MIPRRNFLTLAGGATAAAFVPASLHLRIDGGILAAPGVQGSDPVLVPTPARVFRTTADFNRDRVESWLAYLRVESASAEPITIEGAVVRYAKGSDVRIVETHDAESARALDIHAAPPAGARAPFRLALLRIASTQPMSLGIDRMQVELTVRRKGALLRVARELPLEKYEQRTKLVFPFRGVGIISQGGAANSGHRNRSGMFAIDALGLSPLYAVMARDGNTSDSLAGWGRPIIAPAAGVVVVARGDRPDQPVIGNADPRLFVPEFPEGGDPGNHVVIDHGNGEFSMIAHLQRGTLAVAMGQRVEQGQRLGLLGSSGDSTAPHVHHQLQTGPDWRMADALPHVYENGPRNRHDRGWMFDAG